MKRIFLKRLFCAVLVAMMSLITVAQDFNGTWRGDMIAGPQSIPLVLHIQQSGGELKVTMDSPMQQLYDVPTNATIEGDKISVTEPQGGGTYDWTVYGSLVIGVDNETGVWTLGNPPRIHGDLAFDKKGAVDGERYTVPVPYVKFVLTGTSDYGTDVRMILTGGADGVVHINKYTVLTVNYRNIFFFRIIN